MRLRPTAFGSTLRDTARPSFAGVSPASQCRLSSGSEVRRACANTRAYSAPVRTRAVGGNVAFFTGAVSLDAESRIRKSPHRTVRTLAKDKHGWTRPQLRQGHQALRRVRPLARRR